MSFRRDVIERPAASTTASAAPATTASAARRPSSASGPAACWAAASCSSPRPASTTGCRAARTTWRYFAARCRAEGRSKAHLADREGQDQALELEKAYVRRTLPTGVARGLRDATRRDRRRAGPLAGHRRRRRPGPRPGSSPAPPPAAPSGRDRARAPRFEASRVVVVDVDRPLPPLPVDGPGRALARPGPPARALGRPARRAWPTSTSAPGSGPWPWPHGVWAALGDELADRVEAATGLRPDHLPLTGIAAPDAGPAGPTATATVAIATRDRSTALARCLRRRPRPRPPGLRRRRGRQRPVRRPGPRSWSRPSAPVGSTSATSARTAPAWPGPTTPPSPT